MTAEDSSPGSLATSDLACLIVPALYSMHYSGEEQTVVLCCRSDTMRSVIDKFGEEIRAELIEDHFFTAAEKVLPSQTFFGLVFTFQWDIEILEPERERSWNRDTDQRLYSSKEKLAGSAV